ncbi:MAG: bifunctional demethylmenaquinone methyltransferase/2-methoxy-6-polyprenyl-1,4-benzoquinol methylase UbiE [Bacteroidaceae bacterium]|nr:bifunctional demethylmenaquinone methyltransferase/2-methoxy-6-polyprenyl-1,4-benzoquinol methylase UbiE [Bacteroidaceae bacterium]
MAYRQEGIKPYETEDSKRAQMEQMFDNIAPAYDRMNHTLALGIDRWWRRSAIDALKPYAPQEILDIATGTGDFAILAAQRLKPRHITGADISTEMMEMAKRKVNQQGLDKVISFKAEDCMQLSFGDGTFDAVTVAYGARNFESLDRGLQEIHRVLKPGGHLLLLELASPKSAPMKQLFWIYSHFVIPALGMLFSRDVRAYRYLTNSVQAFPQGEVMEEVIRKAGFGRVTWKRYTFGICTMYLGEK